MTIAFKDKKKKKKDKKWQPTRSYGAECTGYVITGRFEQSHRLVERQSWWRPLVYRKQKLSRKLIPGNFEEKNRFQLGTHDDYARSKRHLNKTFSFFFFINLSLVFLLRLRTNIWSRNMGYENP